jgi:Glycosyltransferase 61
MTVEEPLPAFVRPVKIYSQIPAPSMSRTKVHLSYLESGKEQSSVIDLMRPIHFENIVVSSVYEKLPAFAGPPAPLNSVRNIALNSYQKTKAIARSLSPSVSLEMPVLDRRNEDPNNMAHLLMDVIPYFLYARRVLGMDARLLLRKIAPPFAQLLREFDIYPIHEYRRLAAHFIKIRGSRGLALHDLPGIFDCNGINFIPDVYSEFNFESDVRFDKIFMARRAPRGLTNQAETAALLEKFGYKTVFFEDYSIREQLSIGAQAKHVVAIHGAAMSFLIMNKSIDSVIELFPPHVYHQLFPVCLSPRVAQYAQVLPEFDPRIPHSGWDSVLYFKNRSFRANTEQLEKLLSTLH